MKLTFLPQAALIATSALIGSSALAGPSSDDVLNVLWKGETVPPSAIKAASEASQFAGVSDQLERYRSWILANDYHAAVTDDLRVVLITQSAKSSEKRMAVVADTLDVFDALLSPPDRTASKESYRSGDWGVREHAPDAEPVVLIELEKDTHYQSLLASLEDVEPGMQTWANVQSREPGFADERIMTTGWQAAPDGFEIGQVWRSENELVNRLTRLLLYRSFGPQPNWLNQAAAWSVEYEVMGTIYCFPYRSEFVGIGEHDGWRNEVKNEFKSRKKKPLRLSEFADWKRGTWDQDEAATAWAFVQFLIQEKPGVLPALAEANRLAYKAGFTIEHADGTWETNPSFTVSPEAQLETLTKEGGDDVLEEATNFFRKWKRSRTAKASSKRRRR